MRSLRSLSRQLLALLLIGLVLLVLLTGWIASRTTTNKQETHSTPRSGTVSGDVPGARPFIDTWNNIHLFQTFDYHLSNPMTVAKRYDFVWGAEADHVAAFRSSNPNIFTTYYIPFHRDFGIFADSGTDHDLTYWQAAHPDWVLYKCDRVTPAYEFGDSHIPLDFSNPAVISWQIQTYAQPASENGYDGIAADNVIMQNFFGACGVYKNGHWLQRYSGQLDDPQWRADVINWLKQMQQDLHHLKHPLALISNFYAGNLSLSDPQVEKVVSYSDGVLDEDAFTDEGRDYLTDSNWVQRVQFIESVQKQQKPYYIIDQFPSVGRAEIQWALASYLMGKEHSAALFISTIQGYGTERWYNEYNAQIGTPSDTMYQGQNVYLRDYSHGLSIVNPSASETYTVTLNLGSRYIDLYGNPIGQSITMPPHSGIVLLLHS